MWNNPNSFEVRRFASSLRSLSSSSALPSGGIQTKEEAVKALNELETIRGKFESERDELRYVSYFQ